MLLSASVKNIRPRLIHTHATTSIAPYLLPKNAQHFQSVAIRRKLFQFDLKICRPVPTISEKTTHRSQLQVGLHFHNIYIIQWQLSNCNALHQAPNYLQCWISLKFIHHTRTLKQVYYWVLNLIFISARMLAFQTIMSALKVLIKLGSGLSFMTILIQQPTSQQF